MASTVGVANQMLPSGPAAMTVAYGRGIWNSANTPEVLTLATFGWERYVNHTFPSVPAVSDSARDSVGSLYSVKSPVVVTLTTSKIIGQDPQYSSLIHKLPSGPAAMLGEEKPFQSGTLIRIVNSVKTPDVVTLAILLSEPSTNQRFPSLPDAILV